MLLIKNQRIFHNIAKTSLNAIFCALNTRLFSINNDPLFCWGFFVSTTPIRHLSFNSLRSYYA